MKEKADMQRQHATSRFQEQVETNDAVISARREARATLKAASSLLLGRPQNRQSHQTGCRLNPVANLVYDRGRRHDLKLASNLEVPVGADLGHEDSDEFFLRVDPEVGSVGAAPAIAAQRTHQGRVS